MKVSDRIRLIRKAKGLTQEQAALRAGLKRANYARMESRGDSLSMKDLQTIAKGLGVNVNAILEMRPASEHPAIKNPGASPTNSPQEEIERMFKEIQEYTRRIEELEDRLRDKNSIIANLRREVRLYETLADDLLVEIEDYIVQELRLGWNLRIRSNSGDFQILGKNLTEEEMSVLFDKHPDAERFLTNIEVAAIVDYASKNRVIAAILRTLIDFGAINPKRWPYWISNHEKFFLPDNSFKYRSIKALRNVDDVGDLTWRQPNWGTETDTPQRGARA
jgi:transcriptional regulator with XRE-family HTH domain